MIETLPAQEYAPVTAPVPEDVRPAFCMQEYLFRVLSALLAGLLLLVGTPMNAFLRHSAGLALASGSLGLVFLALSTLARKRDLYLYRAFAIANLLLMNSQWYLNGGSLGRQELAFFTLAFTAVLFLRGASRVVYLAVVAVNGLALYAMDLARPGWTLGYNSASQRLMDHAFTFLVFLLSCAWIVWFMVNAYEAEREELQQAHADLQKSMGELKVLRGFLCMCAWCRRVRDESGNWIPVERYIERHTDASVTHGACPECKELLQEHGKAPTR